jgi:hypothetical protein
VLLQEQVVKKKKKSLEEHIMDRKTVEEYKLSPLDSVYKSMDNEEKTHIEEH